VANERIVGLKTAANDEISAAEDNSQVDPYQLQVDDFNSANEYLTADFL